MLSWRYTNSKDEVHKRKGLPTNAYKYPRKTKSNPANYFASEGNIQFRYDFTLKNLRLAQHYATRMLNKCLATSRKSMISFFNKVGDLNRAYYNDDSND